MDGFSLRAFLDLRRDALIEEQREKEGSRNRSRSRDSKASNRSSNKIPKNKEERPATKDSTGNTGEVGGANQDSTGKTGDVDGAGTQSAPRPRKPIQFGRARDPKIQQKIDDTDDTGNGWVDFDPTELPEDDLSCIMKDHTKQTGLSKNFITYHGGTPETRKELKVRVNGKFRATDTAIQTAPYMRGYVKTTMMKKTLEGSWEVLEDRVNIEDVTLCGEQSWIHMLIFAQELRTTRANIAYVADRVFSLDLDAARIGTL